MTTDNIMGQAPSKPKIPIPVSRMSSPVVKKRRTELDMLSDANIIDSIDVAPRKVRQSLSTTENTESRQRKTPKQHGGMPKNGGAARCSLPSKSDIIRQKDAEIKELRKENEALQNRLAEIEAKYKGFVPPQTTVVSQRKRSATDDKKARFVFHCRQSSDRMCPVERHQQSTQDSRWQQQQTFSQFRRPPRTGSLVSKLDVDEDTPLTTQPYSVYQRTFEPSDNDEPKGIVEVPSWRLHAVSGQTTTRRESEEATSDETYLRRHLKLETEERRRKKWDRQWISEQKRFERARRKQARATTSQNTPLKDPVLTLFPSGTRLQAIEISEKVPVVAWGCTVPTFVAREFSLD